ncbi:MAG: lipopolysaccharide heptosyltransferase II [Deltaproteobacteria bacterium]|nr:lipopolysaccharide heptosyltransferase II [Deltaproteobacteria bacterium]
MITTPQNILIRGVNWLGDALITIPAMRVLRERYPRSRMTLLIKAPLDTLFDGFDAVDEVIGFSVRKGIAGLPDRLRLIRRLRKSKFDLCLILPNSFDSALIPFLSGIPERTGFNRDGRGALLTRRIPPIAKGRGEHQAREYLKLILEETNTPEKLDFSLSPGPAALGWAKEQIAFLTPSDDTPLIGLNPGAAYGPAKMWIPERFSELGTRLFNGIGADILLVGGPSEIALCRNIARRISGEVLDLSGRTDLPQLAAVLSLCDLVVTNDSGPMHLASAVGTPVVALFGSTDPDATSPLGEHVILSKRMECAPCRERICPRGDMRCMKEIEVEDVMEAVIRLLPEAGESRDD